MSLEYGVQRATRRLRGALLIVLCGVGAVLVLHPGGPASRVHAQTATTAAVLQEEVDAVNRGDADTATALFSPHAVVIADGGCFPTACLDTAAIGQHFLAQANQHLQAVLISESVEGSIVTGRLEARFDALAATGVSRVLAVYTMVVQDGRILLWTTMPDLSDPQTAQFLATQKPG